MKHRAIYNTSLKNLLNNPRTDTGFRKEGALVILVAGNSAGGLQVGSGAKPQKFSLFESLPVQE